MIPTFFISHGGGPWPYVPQMRLMFIKSAQWMTDFAENLNAKPTAILSVTGHWEANEFSVSSALKPPMIYDYSGFPENTYKVKYSAPGSPPIAKKVVSLIESAAGMKCVEDSSRGFDHGTFVPLSLMYPNENIPVISFSIKNTYNPAEHIKIGESLKPLREEGVLIIGSGLSYHNLREFGSPEARKVSQTFESWLTQTIEKSPQERNDALTHWESAPSARKAHPQEDHLLPLMVVAGAAGKDMGKKIFQDDAMNVIMASYRFG